MSGEPRRSAETVPIPHLRRPGLLLLLGLLLPLLASLALNARFRMVTEHSGDSQSYLLAAHGLARHGSFGLAGDATPGLGREPAYPLLLAGLMRAGTPLAAFTPACLTVPGTCPDALYRPARWANLAMALASAVLLAWVALRLTGSAVAAVVACAYVALNQQMLKGRWEVISDYLALLLMALLLAALLHWIRRPGVGRAVAAGLAAAALVLTKAIFLPALLLAIPAGLVLRRRLPRHAALVLLVALLPVFGWMLRNHAVAGVFALTDARSGIALSTREVFLHLDAQQIAAAFVFWTRGMGDGLARLLFAPEVWQPFQYEFPGGYYDLGQNRYWPWVARVAAEQGLDEAAARRVVDATLRASILAQPLGWLASYPPLIWRGLWIDEFIVLGFPALVVATAWALRRGHWIWLLLLAPGWYNLLAYPALSLNVPRYQVTAVPALALGAAWLVARLSSRRAATLPSG